MKGLFVLSTAAFAFLLDFYSLFIFYDSVFMMLAILCFDFASE